MSRLKIAPIVEGHGEVAAVPILLRRIWSELLGGEYLEVLTPIREKRYRLANDKDAALGRAIQLAARKLAETGLAGDPEGILVLLDADRDLPCVLGPSLLRIAQAARADKRIACVVANIEFETWFVAGAKSLLPYFRLESPSQLPSDPETQRLGKGWVERHWKGNKYSETIDQPRLAAKLDLRLCRERAPSFDKLCRELDGLRGRPTAGISASEPTG